MKELSAKQLYDALIDAKITEQTGSIIFTLGSTAVTINTTDTVGNSIQAWLGQWMKNNEIFAEEPSSTQIFPDFYLAKDRDKNLLEVKAFNYKVSPAFDVANFESYCDSVKTKAYRIDADYLVFGYTMEDGIISIKKIWLKKIWEIVGKSEHYAISNQTKRKMIYNIRPVSNFKYGKPPVFSCKEEFLNAIFLTLKIYNAEGKGENADDWKAAVIADYKRHCGKTLVF